mgnify:CR=1 FL=1
MTLELSLIIGLLIAVVWLSYEYIQVHRQLVHKTHAHDRSLVHAHEKSLEILEKARMSAAKILKEARIGAVGTRQKLSAKMDSALAEVATNEIDSFKKALQTGTVGVQKLVGEKVASRYDEVTAEIESYKKSQLASVDEKIITILQTVAQKVFAKSIPVEQHVELVLKSLEEAKRDGMFD